MLKTFLGAAAAAALFGSAGEAAVYSFDMTVDQVTVSGFFEVNSASPNYVGGGKTTQFDLVDYSFTFTKGSDTATGTPANQSYLQTFDMTYSGDLSSVVSWDLSLGFAAPMLLAFAGNNVSGQGFAQIVDFDTGFFDAGAAPAPVLTANLIDSGPTPVPLPAGLPLMAASLGLLALARRRVA